MTTPIPPFRFHLVAVSEMLRLTDDHNLEQILLQCTPEERVVDQGTMHHAFCCKISVIEYFEPDTLIQVATLDRQQFVDPNRRVTRMLRVGLDVYILQLEAT